MINITPITPLAACKLLKGIEEKLYTDASYSAIDAHGDADAVLVGLLCQLGYTREVKLYLRINGGHLVK